MKFSNCYFGHNGLPKDMRIGWGDQSKPMPDWKTIVVPEIEDAYPELLRFGPTPSHGFFVRHLKNLEMSHVEVAPQNADPRPAFWLEDAHRAGLFCGHRARSSQIFELRNVSDLRIFWVTRRKGYDAG